MFIILKKVQKNVKDRVLLVKYQEPKIFTYQCESESESEDENEKKSRQIIHSFLYCRYIFFSQSYVSFPKKKKYIILFICFLQLLLFSYSFFLIFTEFYNSFTQALLHSFYCSIFLLSYFFLFLKFLSNIKQGALRPTFLEKNNYLFIVLSSFIDGIKFFIENNRFQLIFAFFKNSYFRTLLFTLLIQYKIHEKYI